MTEHAETRPDGTPPSPRGAGGAQPPSVESIRTWLIAWTARVAELDPAEVDPSEPLSSYGLTSIEAVLLSGELEDWIGLQLPPTLTQEYFTVEMLAEHLATRAFGADPRSVETVQYTQKTQP